VSERLPPDVRRAEILSSMQQTGGDAERAAEAIGISVTNFYARARRLGIDVRLLRSQIRAGLVTAPAIDRDDDGAAADAIATDVLIARAYADAAAMALQVLALQAELEQRDAIIATLTRELEARVYASAA
jgi:hypothetical protein